MGVINNVKALISTSKLTNLANAIRNKTGEDKLYTVDEMVEKIDGMESSVLTSLNVTTNGTYVPESGFDGFSQVDVDVNPDLRPLSVSENGQYSPDGFDGFSEVTVSTYTAEDEGKVLHNGHFVTQDSETITVEKDAAVDTTLISSLSVDVTSPLQRANLANADDVVEGYLDSNGNLQPSLRNKAITTGYIDVSGSTDGKVYIVNVMNMSVTYYTLWGYDENKQKIGSQQSVGNSNFESIGYASAISIPSGAKYVRISFNTGGKVTFAVLLSNPFQVLGETLGWTKHEYTT